MSATSPSTLDPVLPEPARFVVRPCGIRLALRCAGPAGAPAVVLVPGFASHVDAIWDPAGPGPYHARLAAELRVVTYDRRGQGRSTRVAPPDVDEDAADLAAVLDAAGIDRAVVVGESQGGATAIALAAAMPDRVAALVLVGAYARAARDTDYPYGPDAEELRVAAGAFAERWGDPGMSGLFAPSAAGDPDFERWWTTSCRMALTPDEARASLARRAELDVRDRVGAVRAPTLVVHRTGDRLTPIEHGRWLAASVPGATLLELPGEDHLWWIPDPAIVADAILRFARKHAR